MSDCDRGQSSTAYRIMDIHFYLIDEGQHLLKLIDQLFQLLLPQIHALNSLNNSDHGFLTLKIPPHLAYVTLRHVIVRKQAITDKLQGSVATHIRFGGVVMDLIVVFCILSCLYLCLRCCVSVSLPNFRRIKIHI